MKTNLAVGNNGHYNGVLQPITVSKLHRPVAHLLGNSVK
jgi:hypothetical protein